MMCGSFRPSRLADTAWTPSHTDLSKADYKARCRAIQCRVLSKEADQFKGRTYKFTGQVSSIQDAGSGYYLKGFGKGVEPQTDMQLSVTNDGYGNYSDDIMVLYKSGIKVYDKDIVTVWGECMGSYTYTSTAGWKITVPMLWAVYIQKQ
jgi:hypothetical protein